MSFADVPDCPVDDMDAVIPLGPAGVQHAVMDNGMTYYVRHCAKPAGRAALKLVAKVGSILEEDQERGVAHIVEHLAFNASGAHANHEVVTKLEAVGCEFGPCQNAYTGQEETVYELVVPLDEAALLPGALSILRAFAFDIRCGEEDLAKERGPVLEEWRQNRTAAGRAAEAHWQLMMKGSKYADRMPIGLESVIRTVPASTVKAFYQRWYRPEHMALVAVGDFHDVGAVVECIKAELGSAQAQASEVPAPPLPSIPWHEHTDIHCCTFVDREAQQPKASISFKCSSAPNNTAAQMLRQLAVEMLHNVLNRRLDEVCRREEGPFYGALMGCEPLTRRCEAHCLDVVAYERRICEGVEAALTEIARLRMHGIPDRELDLARAHVLKDLENLYLERDQEYSADVAAEYARHFTTGELVISAGPEAQLRKTLLKRVDAAVLRDVVEQYRSTRSCIVKVQEHTAGVTEAELLAVFERVNSAEQAGTLEDWSHEGMPERLLEEEPARGSIVRERHLDALGATQLHLSNGMRVTYRHSDLMQDQVLLSGFAAGGLSQVPQKAFHSARFAVLLAEELGVFGFRPHVLSTLLADKRIELALSEEAFWRTLQGSHRPADMEATMQLLHLLFRHEVEPIQAELKSFFLMASSMVEAQRRDPWTRYSQIVRQLNYGSCYHLKPLTQRELLTLDVPAACAHFSRAFCNPREFSLCFVGNIDEGSFRDLVERFLASIPEVPGIAPIAREDIAPLPVQLPQRPVRAEVPLRMKEAISQVQVTFPVEVQRATQSEDVYWVDLLCKVIERRLTARLRFEGGAVYNVAVSASFSMEAPSREGSVRGDVAVAFSCSPGCGRELGEQVLAEVQRLQEAGPSAEEVATALAIERRAHEEDLQENSWWLQMMMTSYQGPSFSKTGDAAAVFAKRVQARLDMRDKATPATCKDALRRIFCHPCRSRFTLVTTVADSLVTRAVSAVTSNLPTVIGVLATVLAAGAYLVWRSHHRRS